MAVLKKFNQNTQQWEILQGGVQGLQGPPVALAKGTVTTTAAGTNADFSITGTPPAQVLNMTLPRGAAGGWVDPTLLVATDNLDSLVVSGLYMIQSGSGVRASSNWPLDGFAGYIEVVARGSSYILQRATALRATLGSDPSEANLWYRTKFGSTWSPWRKVPVVGRVDTDIVGAGRPDIAGTMTTEVAALVTAATSGAKFRSTDGPQGAWEWRKRGSTWVCVEGDTGWVTSNSLDTAIRAAWPEVLNDRVGHLRRRPGTVDCWLGGGGGGVMNTRRDFSGGPGTVPSWARPDKPWSIAATPDNPNLVRIGLRVNGAFYIAGNWVGYANTGISWPVASTLDWPTTLA